MSEAISTEPLFGDTRRGRFQGMTEVIAYNRPFYLVGGGATLTAIITALCMGGIAATALAIVAGLALFWIVASLLVAHIVYDRSGLASGLPLAAAIGGHEGRWIELHTGLAWTTAILRAGCRPENGLVLDIYDPLVMTEPSIARARRRNGRAGRPADFRGLPVDDRSIDLLFLIFAAHELRSANARRELFGELRRILAPRGRIVLAEHMRGMTNGIAFGPGVLHFFPRTAWREAAARAGLRVTREHPLTPFATVLVIEEEP